MGILQPKECLGIFLLIVLVFFQNSANAEQCRSGCGRSQDVLKTTVGTTYKYNYVGKIDISLSSAEGQVSSTEVKATVLLTQLADCVQVLQLQNVHVGGKKSGQIPDIEKPIKINNKDGLIEDSICVDKSDTQTSLNIKRAIASALSVDLKSRHTTDVFGLCPNEVDVDRAGANVVVTKKRNLNKCAYRENIRQDFLATTFNKNSEIKSSPALQGDLISTQVIVDGVVKTVDTTENYLYIPFSVGKNGAKATIRTKLELAGNSKSNPKVTANTPKSIIFDNPHPVNVPKSAQNVGNILAAVKEVGKTIDVTVSENTAKEFINLIKILRVSNKDDILTVYSQVKSGAGFPDKAGVRKIFVDALLRAGNSDAIQVAVELLKNREFDDLEQKKVYLGLTLARHANEPSLVTAGQLLNQQNLPREAYLGIGNLVGKFCRQHDCENVEAVNKLTQQLIKKLGDNKAANRKEESEMISILKALGNFHHINDQILTKIVQIAKDKTASNRLRVVALETFLSDACKDKLRDAALTILQDEQQDSEIRIKAYLAAAQCPNAKIGNAIKALLEKEPSYQVGGFIVTHIRNIRASANPDKETQKQHLGFINLPSRFPIDFRKWSYNNEFSYAFDTLGIASASESNVIYSQDSWLPRSVGFNLTAEVFGHNVNFLEIETRQENLDRLAAHYFGPKGLLRSSGVLEWWKENDQPIKESLDKIKAKVQKSLRARRDVSKGEIDKLSKEVTIKENTLDKDLDLDLSVKAFGSEVLFLNLNENVQKWTPDAVIDRIIDDLNKGLDKLKNFEHVLRTNLIFLDGEFDYPTYTGFPLRMAVEGSANVQVKTKGAIDVRALLNGNKDTIVKLALVPSVSVEVSGRLTVDTQLFENGLKVVSTLHSALGGDANIEVLNNGNNVELKYNLPVEKQVLVSANHEIVAHIRELGAREVNTPLKFAQNKDFSICVDHLKDYIGLEFCGEYSGPNLSGKQVPILPFPLAGDANVKIEVLKEDVKEYVFRQSVVSTPDKLGGELTLSTIAQNGQKKAGVSLIAEASPEKFIKAEFTSPKYNAVAEARVTLNDREKTILGRVNYFGNEFYGKAGVTVSGGGNRATYKPIIEYKTPKGAINSIKSVEGQIIVEQNGPNTKYIFDNLKITPPNTNKFINIRGDLGKENDALFSNIEISDGDKSASLAGRIQQTSNLLKVNAELKNTFNPNANVKIQGEFKRGNKLESHLTIIHGSDLSSKTNVLTLTNSFLNDVKTPQDYEIATKNRLTYPALNMDIKVDVETKPKKFESEIKVQYGQVNVGTEIELDIDQKQKGDYKLELDLWGLDNKLVLKSSRQILGNEDKIDNTLTVNGKTLAVNGKVKHVLKPQNVDISADLNVILPTHNNPFKIISALKYDQSNLDASQKISSGGTDIVDLFLKVNKAGNANGSIKVNVKNVLVVNGQIKASKGAGSGDILIDLQSLKKQIKGETTFTIQPPKTYTILVTLYPLFNSDKNKKIILSTQNNIAQNSIESKNVIDLIGNKLTVNLKGSKSGDLTNGKVNGELEVILPCGHYFLSKVNRDFKTNNGLSDGTAQVVLEHRNNKNSPGHVLSLNANIKKTNVKEGILDLEYSIAADDSNGKTINSDVVIKRQKTGEEAKMEFRNKVYGSVLKNPIETVYTGNCNKGVGSFKVKTTYGPAASYLLESTYNLVGESAPFSLNIKADLQTQSKVLKNLKLAAAGSFKKARGPTDYTEWQSSSSIYALGGNPEPIIDLSSEDYLKVGPNDGQIKGTLKVANKDPISVAFGYSKQGGETTKQVNINGAIQYEANKNIKADFSLNKVAEHEYKLVGQLDTPVESHKNNKFTVHTKREGAKVTSNAEVISDGQKWTADSLIYDGQESGLDIKVRSPDNKLTQILIQTNQKSFDQVTVDLKLVCERRNFLLEGKVDVDFPSADDFHIKGSLNSPSLKVDKVEYDIQTKPGGSGRKIQVNVKSAGKNLLSGSTSYQVKKEGDATIIEGSGNFKVKEDSKSGNFKLISKKLTQEKNQEQGIDISFDGKIGNKAVDVEYKVTNKQFRLANSYCEEKKECAYIEIDSKVSANGIQQFSQELEIAIDLRKLGLTHEFGLKSVTKRDGYIVDHTVDVHFQNKDQSKYQYSFYVHPKEAGWSLTTPKRVIALEAKSEYPKTLAKDGGKVSLDIVFYLDKKNQPNKKTSLNSWAKINIPSKSLEGEVKLIHPGLQRPLSVALKTSRQGDSGNRKADLTVELDVFAQPAQKLVISYELASQSDLKTRVNIKSDLEIKSSGLGININYVEEYSANKDQYDFDYLEKFNYQVGNTKLFNEFHVGVSRKAANLLIRLFNVDVLRVSNKLNLQKDQQIIDTEIVSYDNNPVVSHLAIKNWNTFKYEIGHKKSPKKLVLNSGLIPGQILDSRADLSTASGTTNLYHASIKLDEANFLKPDYAINSEAIKKLLEEVRGDVSSYVKGLGEIETEWLNTGKKAAIDVSNIISKAAPNLGPVREYYTTELKKLKEEILADKTIKEITDLIQSIFGAVTKVTVDIFKKLSEITEQLAKTVQASFSKALESIEKDLIPHLQKLGKQVLDLFGALLNAVADLILGALSKINQILEKYQEEIKSVVNAFSSLTQDAGTVLIQAYQDARVVIAAQYDKLLNEVQALGAFDMIKEQYEELKKKGLPNADAILGVVKEILNSIYEILPANLVEIRTFLTNLESYLEKKLKNQKVDDLVELDKIVKSFLAIFKKLSALLSAEASQINLANPDLSVNLGLFSKLPRLVAAKFSPLSHILKEDTQGYVDFLLSLVTRPRNLFAPFPLVGLIGQGQHIFTFDGKHFTFPGKCNYLLARDALNGQFTLAGSYSNGLLSAITLSNGKDLVTLKKGGQVLLNNAPSELPIRKESIAAYRDYYTVTLRTDSGALLICTPDLSVCAVKLSGFYHGQIRGLLGNGNNDPYDDFTLPNNEIVASETKFANSYKTQPSCAAVDAEQHNHGAESPVCSKLFSWESSLRLCYKFVKPENFKIACNHGVAAGVKETELTVAELYVTACQEHGIPIHVPEELLKCRNGDKAYDVGEKFSVKLPSKAADIVILVDTVKSNERTYKELVQPLLTEILKELHGKSINDVEFHLITYGGENLWPSHVTVNGKLQFKGKAPNVKFTDGPKDKPVQFKDERIQHSISLVQDIIRSLKLAFGLNLEAKTYSEALEYPFRANAVKSIIAVVSEPCETGKFLPLQKLRTLLFRNQMVKLNLITPFEHLNVKDAKKTKDVVGFNNYNVFTLSQGKKKPEGSSELHKDLQYDDFCVDFTIKNDGNVFVTNNFLGAKGEAKTFVSVAAHNIAEQLTKDESGLDCECKLTSPWGAENVCWQIYSKEKPKKTVARG